MNGWLVNASQPFLACTQTFNDEENLYMVHTNIPHETIR